MKWVFNKHLRPPDGFWYQEADGIRIVADSLDELVQAVRAYRAKACRPLRDPEADVHRALCIRYPAGVVRAPERRAEDGAEESEAPAGEGELRAWPQQEQPWYVSGEDVHPALVWFFTLAVTPRAPRLLPSLTLREEAWRRAAVCSRCSARALIAEESRTEEVELMYLLRLKVQDAPMSALGHVCLAEPSVLLGLAVFLESPPVAWGAPETCWRRKPLPEAAVIEAKALLSWSGK